MASGETGPAERGPEHPKSNRGLVERLKDMLPSKEGDPAQELAEQRARAAAEAEARQAARRADLQARADSGEVPRVPANERYQTGQTPAVNADERIEDK